MRTTFTIPSNKNDSQIVINLKVFVAMLWQLTGKKPNNTEAR